MSLEKPMWLFISIRIIIFILMLWNNIFSSAKFSIFSSGCSIQLSLLRISSELLFINSIFSDESLSFFEPSGFFFFDCSRQNGHFADFDRWLREFCQVKEELSCFVRLCDFRSDMTTEFDSLLESNRNRIEIEINFFDEINRNTSSSWSKDRIVSVWVNILNCLTSQHFSCCCLSFLR